MSSYFSYAGIDAIAVFRPQTEPSWLKKVQISLVKLTQTFLATPPTATMKTQPCTINVQRVPLGQIRGRVNPAWVSCFADRLRPLPQNGRYSPTNHADLLKRSPIVLIQIGDLYFVSEGNEYIDAARDVSVLALEAVVISPVRACQR